MQFHQKPSCDKSEHETTMGHYGTFSMLFPISTKFTVGVKQSRCYSMRRVAIGGSMENMVNIGEHGKHRRSLLELICIAAGQVSIKPSILYFPFSFYIHCTKLC